MSPKGGKRAGAGRKSKYRSGPTKSHTFALPVAVYDEVKRRAEREGKSASEIVSIELRKAFNISTTETDDDDKPKPDDD